MDKGFMSTTLIKGNIENHRHSAPSLKIFLKISVPAGTFPFWESAISSIRSYSLFLDLERSYLLL